MTEPEASSAATTDSTSGASSVGSVPQFAVWAPSPPKVLLAKPSHSRAGSKGFVGSVSPAQMLALRRSVLSAVLTRPEPHSDVGLDAI